jgi:CO/xanthine dehydrogenase FAD-binding subunit
MRAFAYERPTSLEAALTLLAAQGEGARVLAGGTDLIIRLRDGSLQPAVVVDIKGVPELRPDITIRDGLARISAGTTMTDVAEDARMARHFPALVEAAAVVGSVQIRNRATLAGNLCNASPAADTAPPLLVYGAVLVLAGAGGERRLLLDDFFVRSGRTMLAPGELVVAIEVPLPDRPMGATHVRRTRRRGHDLASVTLSCGVDDRGVTRLAYGSMGPRPYLVVDESGTLARGSSSEEARAALLEDCFAAAAPSATSMRASPDYRQAMLRVLARRALATATARLAGEPGA